MKRLKMKNVENTPLIVNSSIDFIQEFVRNAIANKFQNKCEQVNKNDISVFA